MFFFCLLSQIVLLPLWGLFGQSNPVLSVLIFSWMCKTRKYLYLPCGGDFLKRPPYPCKNSSVVLYILSNFLYFVDLPPPGVIIALVGIWVFPETSQNFLNRKLYSKLNHLSQLSELLVVLAIFLTLNTMLAPPKTNEIIISNSEVTSPKETLNCPISIISENLKRLRPSKETFTEWTIGHHGYIWHIYLFWVEPRRPKCRRYGLSNVSFEEEKAFRRSLWQVAMKKWLFVM